jgi:hypothetical protein
MSRAPSFFTRPAPTIGRDPALTLCLMRRLRAEAEARPARPSEVCARLDGLVLPNPPLRTHRTDGTDLREGGR